MFIYNKSKRNNQSGRHPLQWKYIMVFDLATNLTPILNGVIAILPLFLDLVIAMVPIVITLAVVGFLLSFFDKILGMIKF